MRGGRYVYIPDPAIEQYEICSRCSRNVDINEIETFEIEDGIDAHLCHDCLLRILSGGDSQ